MLDEFRAPQPESLIHLMPSLTLCLKRQQRMVSGTSKEHQATGPLNALSVRGYDIVPWAMVSPVADR